MKYKLSLSIIFCFMLFAAHGKIKAQVDFNILTKQKQSQQYFLIDLKSTDYTVDVVELNSKALYGIDLKVELYNVHYDENKLVLFSILPVQSKESWSEIKIESINPVHLTDLKKIHENGFQTYKQSGSQNSDLLKRNDIQLIIKKNGKYFVSNYCITEFFYIIDQNLVFPNLMGNIYINVKSPIFTVKDYESKYQEVYNHYSANVINASGTTSLTQPLERPLNFYSGLVHVSTHTAYRFWQFSDWRVIDSPNSRRGVDRFLYIPKIGVVGGSFDFWFKKYDSLEHLKQNYLSEKVMLPVSINGKPLDDLK